MRAWSVNAPLALISCPIKLGKSSSQLVRTGAHGAKGNTW